MNHNPMSVTPSAAPAATSLLGSLKRHFLRAFFRRYMRWRLPELMYPEHVVVFDQEIDLQPRYGYGHPPHEQLYKIIDRSRPRYQRLISDLGRFENDIHAMALLEECAPSEPSFHNRFFTGLDAIVLYYIIASRKPPHFFEIGSGFSTRFARRAVRAHSPATRIFSCDPSPRSIVDGLCDVAVRERLEKVGSTFLKDLRPGDILFVDSSHRCYMDSDVCVMFLEVLPRLPSGVIVHFHDIFLPYDYPPGWAERYYNEQYLLASFLLSNPERCDIIFPGAFIGQDRDLQLRMKYLWKDSEAMRHVLTQAESLYMGFKSFSFWFETVSGWSDEKAHLLSQETECT